MKYYAIYVILLIGIMCVAFNSSFAQADRLTSPLPTPTPMPLFFPVIEKHIATPRSTPTAPAPTPTLRPTPEI